MTRLLELFTFMAIAIGLLIGIRHFRNHHTIDHLKAYAIERLR
jgi:hypothetical protein